MAGSRVPKAGEFYRHFKNRLYQVITIAYDHESGEANVVYQALYGDYKTYIRPLENFMSEVDHVKYPEVTQVYRFEKVTPKAAARTGAHMASEPVRDDEGEKIVIEEETGDANAYLVRFLEADDYETKKNILIEGHDKFNQSDIDSIYVSLGITGFGGSEKQQIQGLVKFLDMQDHYEGSRLRK